MTVLAMVIGAVAFLIAHGIQAAMWTAWFSDAYPPWFLNSGRAVAFTALCFFLAGAIAGAAGDRTRAIRTGALVGTGGLIAAAIVLVWRVGSGNLFPIAMAIGAVVLLASSIAGALVARRRPAVTLPDFR